MSGIYYWLGVIRFMTKYIYFISLLFILFILPACGGTADVNEQPYPTEEEYLTLNNTSSPAPPTPTWWAPPTMSPPPSILEVNINNVNITFVTDNWLRSFNNIHELDYHDVSNTFQREPISLGIWTTVPITDFSFILLGHEQIFTEMNHWEMIFVPIYGFFTLPIMHPHDVLVVNNIWVSQHVGLGTPGITFVDENGIKRYYGIQSTPDDLNNPFILVEVQNRADELPDDWRPSWITFYRPKIDITAPSSTEHISKLLAETGISEYGWQVAADFLRDMTSIFTGIVQAEVVWDDDVMDYIETGRFILGHDRSTHKWITTYDVPDLYYVLHRHGIRGIYNLQGERIHEAPWMCSWGSAYAVWFDLFDFDNTGIPEIMITMMPIFDGVQTGPTSWEEVFRYVDGEYRRLELRTQRNQHGYYTSMWNIPNNIFLDESGRFITLYSDSKSGTFFGFEELFITDDYVMLYPVFILCREEHDDEVWRAWHDHVNNIFNPEVTNIATIFSTDIELYPLYSFRDLSLALFIYMYYERSS